MKRIKQPEPSLARVLQQFLAWLDFRWYRLTDEGKHTIIWTLILLMAWTIVSGITHGDLPYPTNIPRWAWSGTKTVVCWPIKKAVECCIPSLQVRGESQSPRIFYLKGKFSCEVPVRYVVETRERTEPAWTISPAFEFEPREDCGKRWYPDKHGPSDSGMNFIVTISPKSPHLYVTTRGSSSPITLRRETWDAIKIGDILEICGREEEGNGEDGYSQEEHYAQLTPKTAPAMALIHGGLMEREQKHMFDQLIHYLNKVEDQDCAEDKRNYERAVEDNN